MDNVLPQQPVRQWVLSLPFALCYLLATQPEVVTQVLGIVYRAISGHLIRKAGLTRASAVTGAVTLIQRFGSALSLNVHVHRAHPCAWPFGQTAAVQIGIPCRFVTCSCSTGFIVGMART